MRRTKWVPYPLDRYALLRLVRRPPKADPKSTPPRTAKAAPAVVDDENARHPTPPKRYPSTPAYQTGSPAPSGVPNGFTRDMRRTKWVHPRYAAYQMGSPAPGGALNGFHTPSIGTPFSDWYAAHQNPTRKVRRPEVPLISAAVGNKRPLGTKVGPHMVSGGSSLTARGNHMWARVHFRTPRIAHA